MGRRGFGYVALLTTVITLVGAAGMYTFEGPPRAQEAAVNTSAGYNESFEDYGDALWWTAMVMTTMGSEGWPQTVEGRILGVLLSLYAFAVFGYVTAALASFFIGREAESPESELVGTESLDALRIEIRALREQVKELRER